MNNGTIKQEGGAWKRKIHFEIEKEGNLFYLCNQVINTFPEKRTINKNKVNCLNCLRILKKTKCKN